MCAYQNQIRQYPAPKRGVRRVHRQLQVVPVDSCVNTGLYTATEKETLIRTIIQLVVSPPEDQDMATIAMAIDIEREGQAFDEALAEGNITADEAGLERLWLHQSHFIHTTLTEAPNEYINVDLKSMRKLSIGDAIDFRHVSSTAVDGGKVTGVITFFFKEK